MKKLLLAAVLVLGSLAYVFINRADADTAPSPSLAIAAQTSSAATVPDASSSIPSSTAAPTTTSSASAPKSTPAPAQKTGQYRDGTYAGRVADAYYGNVQVEAVIAGGRLSNVKVLQYPNDRGTSIEINSQALPMLISEAISAQSANVDGISGASDTSPAFVQSLSSALAKAKA